MSAEAVNSVGWRGYPATAPKGAPVRYCTHCGDLGTATRPVESVGEAGESGGGSMVYAHPTCWPTDTAP
ncbi:hypothetical protein [Streptomyces phytophilus]|uniref:hypothetical protein n=1 Tax=Streptomyces phytophilus TaxID=722715 RepID=UPI0015F0F5F1|nr:hypothetical protein [Streptomyces phytophilus]